MIGVHPPRVRRQSWRMRTRLLAALPVAALVMLVTHLLYGGGPAAIAIAGLFGLFIAAEVLRALTTDDGF